MMSHSSRRPSTPRRGAALVEFAFVATVTLLFFFVILEYARFVFLLQVATNAAREGARMASAHTGDGTTTQNIIDEVTARMAGRDKELAGFTVQVLNVDPATGNQIPSSSWDKAAFANGNAIMVRITGNYSPILPGLLLTRSSLPIQATAVMSSEGN
jgi:Flp pilus assembly protein TadG